MDGGKAFIELRDRLLRAGIPHNQALDAFQWPNVDSFNWASDYFDRIALHNERTALRVVHDTGADRALSFAALARRSNQVAAFLAAQGVRPGDRVLRRLEADRTEEAARRPQEYWEDDCTRGRGS